MGQCSRANLNRVYSRPKTRGQNFINGGKVHYVCKMSPRLPQPRKQRSLRSGLAVLNEHFATKICCNFNSLSFKPLSKFPDPNSLISHRKYRVDLVLVFVVPLYWNMMLEYYLFHIQMGNRFAEAKRLVYNHLYQQLMSKSFIHIH